MTGAAALKARQREDDQTAKDVLELVRRLAHWRAWGYDRPAAIPPESTFIYIDRDVRDDVLRRRAS